MLFGKFVYKTGTTVFYSKFEGKEINEYNLTIATVPGESLSDQVINLRDALLGFLELHHLQQKNILFQRIFASDISNQGEALKEIAFCTAVSFVQQPPFSNAKISTWIILLQPVNANANESVKSLLEFAISALFHTDFDTGFIQSILAKNCQFRY
ncbi:MAG TPA: hypothetical protein VIK55_04110 [Paludibacter sp.]